MSVSTYLGLFNIFLVMSSDFPRRPLTYIVKFTRSLAFCGPVSVVNPSLFLV